MLSTVTTFWLSTLIEYLNSFVCKLIISAVDMFKKKMKRLCHHATYFFFLYCSIWTKAGGLKIHFEIPTKSKLSCSSNIVFNIIICACWQLLLSLGIWWSQHTESATAILGYWWNAVWRKSDLPNSEPAGRMCRLGWAVSSFKVRKFLAGTCCNQLSL